MTKKTLMFAIVPDHAPGPVIVPPKAEWHSVWLPPEKGRDSRRAPSRSPGAAHPHRRRPHDIRTSGRAVILRSRADWEVMRKKRKTASKRWRRSPN